MIFREEAEKFKQIAEFLGAELEPSKVSGEIYRGMWEGRLLVLREKKPGSDQLEVFFGIKEMKERLLLQYYQCRRKEVENESGTD